MKRLWLGLLCLALVSAAWAANPARHEPVEASMVVTGAIEVAPDGSVQGYTLDRPERIAPLIAEVVRKTVTQWTFEPVLRDGKPVGARTPMSLRLVAEPTRGGEFEVAIRSAHFGGPDNAIKRDMSEKPRYPEAAVRDRIQGTVYLVLRIDRAGKVDQAFAEQVNLRVVASETRLKRWRRLLAEPSVAAARHWTFAPATADDARPYRNVRVPVAYTLRAFGSPAPDTYGQWVGYVRGPLEATPWLDASQMLGGGVDALPADGGVFGESSLSLLTPLDRS